ncbi:MAG: PPOX class F420-dependent oxidoreductase [Chloroflexota bacterium]
MDTEQALAFVKRNHRGVMATIKRDGWPQLSSVAYLLDDDGVIKISVTADRAKTRNLRRDPRATIECLDVNDWYSYVVVDGPAAFVDDESAVPELRRIYREIRGEEHPNWDEFDQAMRAEHRVVLCIRPEHVYGMLGNG